MRRGTLRLYSPTVVVRRTGDRRSNGPVPLQDRSLVFLPSFISPIKGTPTLFGRRRETFPKRQGVLRKEDPRLLRRKSGEVCIPTTTMDEIE